MCRLATEVDEVSIVVGTTVVRLEEKVHVAWDVTEQIAIKIVTNNAVWSVAEKVANRIAFMLTTFASLGAPL